MSKDIPLKHFTPQKIDFIDEEFIFFLGGGVDGQETQKVSWFGEF